jgi:1,4-alpha-glucan branching enzyme
MALHKLLRLVTFALGGDGYLNFIGNEFGHPEWVDFPRAGNNWSYKYARRQWHLVDDPALRYRDLAEFDQAMMRLDSEHGLLSAAPIERIDADETRKTLVARRGPFVLAFNFHPTASHADYRIGVPEPADYRVLLNSDDLWFGGHAIVAPGQVYPIQRIASHGREQSVQIYLPARTAQVLWPVNA